MNYKLLLSQIPKLLLPPAYYIIRDRKGWRRDTSHTSSVSSIDLSTSQVDVLEKLKNYGIADLIGNQSGCNMLWREFCNLLTSDASTAKAASLESKEQGILGAIEREGYCHQQGFFTRETILALGQRIKADYNNPESSLWKFVHTDSLGKTERFNLPIDYYPELKTLINNDKLEETASKYLKKPVSLLNDFYLDVKTVRFANESPIVPHFDSCFKSVKYFIPLADITEENAPFVYYPKTHLLHEWRVLRDFLLYSGYNSAWSQNFSYFSPNEMSDLADKLPQFINKAKTLPAAAGDIIAADTRGVHSGTYLIEGSRFQLVISCQGACYYTPYDPRKRFIRNSMIFG